MGAEVKPGVADWILRKLAEETEKALAPLRDELARLKHQIEWLADEIEGRE